jgi:Fe-S cluster biogenesis protein NfuA
MKIQKLYKTPNPQGIILQIDQVLTPKFQSEEYEDSEEVDQEWIKSILENEQISSVMLQENQVTLKLEEGSWDEKRETLRDLADHVREADISGNKEDSLEDQKDLDPKMELIRTVLEQEILPYLKSHGGDIKIIELTDDNNLVIEYKGACGGCPASLTGTLRGIQNLLQKEVDPDLEVKLSD